MNCSKARLLLGTLGLLLATTLAAMPLVALASDVATAVVDATAPTGSTTLQPGGSQSIAINLTVTGNQVGTAAFKVYRDWTLSGGTFTGSNPQTFSVDPQTAGTTTKFTATGTVNVASGQAAGSFTLSVGAFDITNSNTTGAKLAAGASSNYQVTVAMPQDTTPPVVASHVSGTLGNNGWYISNVTVSWDVTDPESSITSKSGCDTITITSDTAGTTLTCAATSAGGTSSGSVTIKRDATAPTITWLTASPIANSAGWNNTNVSVPFTPADSISGVASATPPSPLALSSEGQSVTGTVTVTDVAGNSATFTSPAFKIDKTAPAASPTQNPPANSAGWNRDDVTVTWNWADNAGGSGIDSANCTTNSTSSGDGTITLYASCKDVAGNTKNAQYTVKVDRTAPIATPTQSPAANGAGWNRDDVTVTWNWSDSTGGSGIDSANCATSSNSSGEGTITLNATCKDLAGNTASASYTVKVDKTPPTILWGTAYPTANDNGWNNTDVSVPFSPDDALSGVASFSPDSPLTLSSEGQGVTGTVTVTDVAGNSATFTSPAFKIDKTAPTATPTQSPAVNGAGWNKDDVTVTWNWSDSTGGSGIDSNNCTTSSNSSGEGTITLNATCKDLAGNTGSASYTVHVDKTPPTIGAITLSPGGPYLVDQKVTASYDYPTDGLSGIATVTPDTNNGSDVDTSSAGVKTFTVTATDNAGNAASRSVTYTVYGIKLLYDPTKASKLGSTIPIKIQLVGGNGANVSSPDITVTATGVTKSGGVASEEVEDSGNANPDDDFRYDPSLQGYIYNLSTKGLSTGTFYTVSLNGGAPSSVGFAIK